MADFISSPFDTGAAPAPGLDPMSEIKKLFSAPGTAAPTDPDPLGLVTEKKGKEFNMGWDRGTVLGLNLYGTFMTADEIRAQEGGAELLALSERKRGGRRGFWEALTTGPGTDFVPYLGDLASFGISIKNMKPARDSFTKLREQGPEALTARERVLAGVYSESMEREASQTWLGTTGGIMRLMPAFALEFVITGGIMKAGAGVLKLGQETVEKAAMSAARAETLAVLQNQMKKTALTRAAISLEDDVVRGIAAKAAAKAGVTGEAFKAVEKAAVSAARAAEQAFKNPNRFRDFAGWAAEHAKRGLFAHGDDIFRDIPGVKAKLADAAGLLLIEAPVRGALQSSFDFWAVNPVAARVFGAEEAVTRNELMFATSPYPEVYDNAKMLAFGSAWAEYAGENVGRAFSRVGEVIADVAARPGRKAAAAGLRAVPDAKAQGSFIRKLMTYVFGDDAAIKESVTRLQAEAAAAAVEGKAAKFAGKTAEEILGDRGLLNAAMREHLKFKQRSFFGYWMTTKMMEKGLTPTGVSQLFERMGYDGVVEEWMEERYTGFVQGLFGLDGSPDKGFIESLANAAKQTFPDTWGQGFAELVAFSVPMATRAAVLQGYKTLGAGNLSQIRNSLTDLVAINEAAESGVLVEGEGGVRSLAEVPEAEAPGAEQKLVRERAGKVRVSSLHQLPRMGAIVDGLMTGGRQMTYQEEDKVGLGTRAARTALGLINLAASGDPSMLFHDPTRWVAYDAVGRDASWLMLALSQRHRELYSGEVAKRAGGETAEGVRKDVGLGRKRETAGYADADIEAAIEPEYRAAAETLMATYLTRRGVVAVTDAQIERFIDRFQDKDGLFPSEAGDRLTRAQFKKAFADGLSEAAAGRMTWEPTGGGHGVFRYLRAEEKRSPAEVAVEEMMALYGVESFTDMSKAADPMAVTTAFGTRLDVDVIERAAAGDGAARMEVYRARTVAPGESVLGVSEDAIQAAVDDAVALTALYGTFLQPRFETPAGGQAAIARTKDGKFEAGGQMFPSYAKAQEHAVSQLGWRALNRGAIVQTPYLSFWSSHAAAFFHRSMPGARAYFEKMVGNDANVILNSPYMEEDPANPGHTLEFAAARTKAEAQLREARDKGEPLPEWERVARKAMAAIGVTERANPGVRGEPGFMLTPGALSDGNGTVYLPYKHFGSPVFAVEDAIESASKRSPGLFVMQGPGGAFVYRPAVRGFFGVVRKALLEHYKEMSRSDAASAAREAEQARLLTDMFDPNAGVNLEALSKAIAAFVYYFGAKGSWTGAAFYATLGAIAPEVRKSAEYNEFHSLAEQLAGGSGFGAAVPAADLVTTSLLRHFVPRGLRDNVELPTGLTQEQKRADEIARKSGEGVTRTTPLTHAAVAAASYRTELKLTDAGLTGFRGSPAVSAEETKRRADWMKAQMRQILGEEGGSQFLEEDRPQLARELGARYLAAQASAAEAAAEAEAEVKAEAEAKADSKPESKPESEAETETGDETATPALMETALAEMPALMSVFARERGGLKVPDLDVVFDWFKARNRRLPESARALFKRAAAAEGMLKTPEEARRDLERLREIRRMLADPETDDGDAAIGDETEAGETRDGSVAGYSEAAAIKAMEDEPAVRFFFGALAMPLTMRDSRDELVRTLWARSIRLSPVGADSEWDTLATLFDEDAWARAPRSQHPAFADEAAFALWTSKARAETKDPLIADAMAALRAMGMDAAFELANQIKGAYQLGIYRADAGSGTLSRRTMAASVDVASVMTGTARPEAAADALAKLESARRRGFDTAKFKVIAEAADLLFGADNPVSAAARDYRLQTRLLDPKAKKRGTYLTWLDSYVDFGLKEEFGGLLVRRLIEAADTMRRGGTPEAAVLQLLRGDSIAKAPKDTHAAGDRGAFYNFLDEAAAVISRPSDMRPGRHSERRVRGYVPALAYGQRALLASPEFEALAKGKSKKELAFYRRFATHADGTPVFATVSAVASFRSDSVLPTEAELERVLRRDFVSGKDGYVKVALAKADKKRSVLVTWPRSGLAALVPGQERDYDAVRKRVSEIMRLEDVELKRAFTWMAPGAAAAFSGGVLALAVAKAPGLRESLKGKLVSSTGPYADYSRRRGFGDSAKDSYTAADYAADAQIFSGKGQIRLPVADDALQSEADRRLAELAESAKDGADDSVLLGDLDGFKNSAVTDPVLEGGKSVLDVLLENDGNVNVPVRLRDGTETSPAALLPGLEVRDEGDVTLVRWRPRGGWRAQWAAAPAKPAALKYKSAYVNVERILPEFHAIAAEGAAAGAEGLRLLEELDAAEGRAPVAALRGDLPADIEAALYNGFSYEDSVIASVIQPKLVSRAKAALAAPSHVYGADNVLVNDGAVVVEDENGVVFDKDNAFPEVGRPYGKSSELTHTEYAFPDADVKRYRGTLRPAAQRANIRTPGMRYQLMVDTAKLGGFASAADGLAAIFNTLRALESDPQAYRGYLMNTVMPLFKNADGTELPQGIVFDFSDVYHVFGEGKAPAFDPAFVYDGAYAVDVNGKKEVMFAGRRFFGIRTPSDGLNSGQLWTAAEPVSRVAADGSQRYRTLVLENGEWKPALIPYAVGTPIPGADAELHIDPVMRLVAGSDEDGDHRSDSTTSGMSDGRAYPRIKDPVRYMRDAVAAAVAKAREDGTDVREAAETAVAVASRAIAAGLNNARMQIAVAKFRNLDTERVRNPPRDRTKPWSTLYTRDRMPVTPSPYSAAYEVAEFGPGSPKPKSGTKFTDAPAEASDSAFRAGNVRSIAVAAKGVLETMYGHGVSYAEPVAGGVAILKPPPGAKAPYWSREGAFTMPGLPAITEARWLEVIERVAGGITNTAFDDLKKQLAGRAGFTPWYTKLYLMLLAWSDVSTQDEYEAFDKAIREWYDGPEGQAVANHAHYLEDPDGHGGAVYGKAAKDWREYINTASANDNAAAKRVRRLSKTSGRDVVDAIAIAAGGGAVGLKAAAPMEALFTRAAKATALETVASWRKTKGYNVFAAAALDKAAGEVYDQLADGGGVGFKASAQGEALLRASAATANELSRRMREAARGTVEASNLFEEAGEGADVDFCNRVTAADAVIGMLPRRVWDKIESMLAADTSEAGARDRTANFMVLTETVFAVMFKSHAALAKARGAAFNSAFAALLAPRQSQNGASVITLVAADAVAADAEVLTRALEELRDWTPENPGDYAAVELADVGVTVTPAEFYWMLMLYASASAPKSLGSGMGRSLLPLFGTGVLREVSDRQIESFRNPDVETVARVRERVSLPKSLATKAHPAQLRFANVEVPDVLRASAAAYHADIAGRRYQAPPPRLTSDAEPPQSKAPPVTVSQPKAEAPKTEAPKTEAPLVPGENIVSSFNTTDRSSEFGARLTNVTTDAADEISDVPGLVKPTRKLRGGSLFSAENWYQTNKSKLKGAAADAEDMDVMTRVIAAKLRQHPELVQGIADRGGRVWIENSRHIVFHTLHRRPSGFAWEGRGTESGFIRALAKAYAEAVVDVEAPDLSTPLARSRAAANAARAQRDTLPTLAHYGAVRFKAERAAADVEAAAAAADALSQLSELPWAKPYADVIDAAAGLVRDYGPGREISQAVYAAIAAKAKAEGDDVAAAEIRAVAGRIQNNVAVMTELFQNPERAAGLGARERVLAFAAALNKTYTDSAAGALAFARAVAEAEAPPPPAPPKAAVRMNAYDAASAQAFADAATGATAARPGDAGARADIPDGVDAFDAVGKRGTGVRVIKDAAVGWAVLDVESGTMTPITDAVAQRYWNRRTDVDSKGAVGPVTASLKAEVRGNDIVLRMLWHEALAGIPERVKKQQTLAQQLQRIQAPKDEAAAFLKWAGGKTGDSAELLAQYEAEVLPKLEIALRTAGPRLTVSEAEEIEHLMDEFGNTREEAEARVAEMRTELPTQTYSALSVNKGQGEYKEYFIRTPFPVPGQHGGFQDPNLAGWFRVREYADGTLEVQEIQTAMATLFELADWADKTKTLANIDAALAKLRERLAKEKAAGIDTTATENRIRKVEEARGQAVGFDAPWAWRGPNNETFLMNALGKNKTHEEVFVNAIVQWARNRGAQTQRTITRQKWITREDLKRNPGTVYLFGDNLAGYGLGGQAKAMRGEPNAVGIPTKKLPSMAPNAFMNDAEYESNIRAIDAAFAKIPSGASVVVPEDGLGTGLARLDQTAPRTFVYLQQKLAGLSAPRNQGFTKVRFPTGETAARVEGHQVLADRLAALQAEKARVLAGGLSDARYASARTEDGMLEIDERYDRTVEQIDAEIQQLKTQGIEKLVPIEAFYEKRVAAIVNRMGAKPVTDSNANTWREVTVTASLKEEPGDRAAAAVAAIAATEQAILAGPNPKYDPFKRVRKDFDFKDAKGTALRFRLAIAADGAAAVAAVDAYAADALDKLPGFGLVRAEADAVAGAVRRFLGARQTVSRFSRNVLGRRSPVWRAAMIALGNSQARILEELETRRMEAERAGGAEADAVRAQADELEKLTRSLLLTLRASASALYHSQEVADAADYGVPEDADGKPLPPPPADPVMEMNGISPETGVADPWNDVRVRIMDTEAFVAGAVMPWVRGIDIRSVLLDKDALAALPAVIADANHISAVLGIGNPDGYILPMYRDAGTGIGFREGEAVVGAPAAGVVRFGPHIAAKALAQAAKGENLNEAEFDMATWYARALDAFVGDGGHSGRNVLLGVYLAFSDLNHKSMPALTAAAADAAAASVGRERGRPYAIHVALQRVRDLVPPEIYTAFEAAVQSAAKAFVEMPQGATPAQREQAALEEMDRAGFALARVGADKRLVKAQAAIPVRVTFAAFRAHSAYAKLKEVGKRTDADLAPETLAARAVRSWRRASDSARALGILNGDGRLFHDAGGAAPWFVAGHGYARYHARKAVRKETLPLTAAQKQLYAEFYDAARNCFETEKETDADGNVSLRYKRGADGLPIPRPFNAKTSGRMIRFLIDANRSRLPADITADALVKEIEAGLHANGRAGFELAPDATAWDVAKAVYASSSRRLYESAASGGTLASTKLDGVIGLAEFNRIVVDVAAETGADAITPLAGATYSDIYRATGAMPANHGLDEALAAHGQNLAVAARYRLAMCQLLLTSDERGMPLVYMRPGDEGDDTIPDRIWQQAARWWAQAHAGVLGSGASYDESKSGRENAERLYALVTVNKTAAGGQRAESGGVQRLIFTDVTLPPGTRCASACRALKDAAGDDTKGLFTVWAGGEAAAVAAQAFAIPGFNRADAQLHWINHILSFSKSASVMASLFFPIAAIGESQFAATGFLPTVTGFSKTLRGLARKTGADLSAPGMAEILRGFASDDPGVIDLKTLALLSGYTLADRAHTLMDHDRRAIQQDIKWTTDQIRARFGDRGARNVRILLEGALNESSELVFEYVINAVKLAVFAQVNNRLRNQAVAAGRWWDPVREMRKVSPYINAEVGGIDPALYPWAGPKAQNWMRGLMFSWQWTLGAWEAAGGGLLTQKLFGASTTPASRGLLFGRWLRMYFGVMLGVPMGLQMLATAFAAAGGDKRPDDQWFTWRNESGRELTAFDITPFLRHMANAHVLYLPFLPTWGGIKRAKIPLLSALIPALTGDEGEMQTTGRRRYYMHFGKQGWEVGGWLENPTRTMLSKMSMPAQRLLEGVLGITPATGWEKPFSETGFWERWLSLDPDKSAALNMLAAVKPFSLAALERSPEAGLLSAVGPIGKGMSKTRAEKEMAAMFRDWAEADTFYAKLKGEPGAFTDLLGRSTAWLEALRRNGYDPGLSLKNALTAARKPLYERVHKALPRYPGGEGDSGAAVEAGYGLRRLDFVGDNLMKSLRARDKAQHIQRTGDLGKISDEILRKAFGLN